MSRAEQILQAIRTANPGKMLDELYKMERLAERFPHSETSRFLNAMLKLFVDAKREPKG